MNNQNPGIYETIRCYQNKIWNFNAHYNRLLKGANYLNLKFDLSTEQLQELIEKEITKNQFLESRIRLTLNKAELKIKCTELKNGPLSNKLVTYKGTRPITEIKNNDRLLENKALAYAHSHSAVDALLIDNQNYITEGSISNFFIVKNNTLITPNTNILKGTTRDIVLKLAKKMQIPVQLQNIHLNDLKDIQEAFITNAIKQIVPIFQINQQKLSINKITSTIQLEFQNMYYKLK